MFNTLSCDEILFFSILNKGGCVTAGELMKKQRELLKLNRDDMAKKVEVKSSNWIWNVESGRNPIPINKIEIYRKAYMLPISFSVKVLKEQYPDYWELAQAIFSNVMNEFEI